MHLSIYSQLLFAEVRSNDLSGITSSSCRVEAEKVFCDLTVMGFVWLAVSEYCWI